MEKARTEGCKNKAIIEEWCDTEGRRAVGSEGHEKLKGQTRGGGSKR